MGRFLGVVGVVVGASACSGTVVTEGATGSGSSSTAVGTGGFAGTSSTAGTGGIGGTTGSGGVAPGVCTTLTAGPVQIIDGPGSDEELESLAPTTTGAIAGFRHIDGAGNAVWSVLSLGPGGQAEGAKQVLLTTHPTGSVGPIEVATLLGNSSAAIAWDVDDGCTFLPIALGGQTPGPPSKLPLTWCSNLVATNDGFSFFGGSASLGFVLGTADAPGLVIQEEGIAPINALELRQNLPDGSFVATSAQESAECADCPLHVQGTHFSLDGKPLGPPQPLFGDPQFGLVSDLDHVALISTSAGLLAGFSPSNPDDGLAGSFDVVAFGADGAAPTAVQTIAPPSGKPLGGIALTELSTGEAVATWLVADTSTQTTLYARPLGPTGTPYTPALQVVTGPVGGGFTRIKAVRTPSGAIVVAQAGGVVAAVTLGCGP